MVVKSLSPHPRWQSAILALVFLLRWCWSPSLFVEGVASGPLLGGAYIPTTDVSHIATLSQIVHAISLESDITNGTALYKRKFFSTTNNGLQSFSLEGIFRTPTTSTTNGATSTTTSTTTTETKYVNSNNNPMYNLYMHALWRSTHGSGSNNNNIENNPSSSRQQSRTEYTFIDESVDNYGATIVDNMLSKPTGYNPALTAETIKVITTWMAFVQSTYDSVSLCAFDENSNGDVITTMTTDIDDPAYISPVDIAAAFWYGNFRVSDTTQGPQDDGSLYAWTMIAKSNFGPTVGFGNDLFDANDAITSSLSKLQKLLPTCLIARTTSTQDQDEGQVVQVAEYAKRMRILADDIVRYATVPMIQHLIHHCASLAMGVNMTTATTSATADDGDVPVERSQRRRRVQELDDVVDWIILYGLATIPPIRVCDESAFDDLYTKLVANAKDEVAILDDESGGTIESLDQSVLLDILRTLFSRLSCFGITCEHIGTANVLLDKTTSANDGPELPICSSSSSYVVSSNYAYGDGTNTDIGPFMQQLKIDLDVRTIGRLVEMDSPAAAYDVYRWGRHIRSPIAVDPMTGRDINDVEIGVNSSSSSSSSSSYITNLRDMSVDYHERNVVALAYDNYLESHTDLFTVVSSLGSIDDYEFSDVYVSEVMKGRGKYGVDTTTTPSQRCVIIESILPLILLHVHALDQFYDAVDDCRANIVETTWDVGFAALTGWVEEMSIDGIDDKGFLALSWTENMSTLRDTFVLKLKEGKESLRSLQVSCDEAESIVKDIENLMLTILIDGTAYYADRLSSDVLNKDYLAYGHSVAMALIPLITSSNPIVAATIERNMGGFGPDATPLIDGLESTMDALSTIVSTSNNTIYCNYLYMTVLCEGGGDAPGPAPTPPAPTPDLDLEASTTPPVTVDSDLEGTYYPTMVVGGTGSNEIDVIGNLGEDDDEVVSCKAAIDGGLPAIASTDTISGDTVTTLLGGVYQPDSDVSHIIELTKRIELISNSTDELIGLNYYTSAIEDGFSLQCLSLGIKKKYILQSNPMFVITTYGLWMSELGDNDPDGYSSKLFNGDDILYYGDNIVMDEFDKESGYDGVFSAITIQVMNMWMAMITELYRAAYLCRNGIQMEFSPVDFAAALWFGTADKDSFEGGSLYAWAKTAGQEFTSESFLLTAEVTNRLKVLQTNFADCQILSGDDAKDTGVAMKHEVHQLVRILTVPMVQYFIHYLAIESGQPTTTDTRNHMVLYGIHVLSWISICDMSSANDLYTLLISGTEDTVTLNVDTFAKTVEILQAKYHFCLGITCDMVGVYNGAPKCTDPSVANTAFAGYVPTSDQSLEILHMDLDIITILSFIIMEAADAALDIFRNGRNAKSPNYNSDAEDVSLDSITTPTLETAANTIYQSYSGEADGRNYMEVTPHAISGIDAFQYTSLLTRSAAASLAIATIDLHMVILLYTNEASVLCTDDGSDSWGGSSDYWDSAVAAYVGSSEGEESGGSDVSGFLLFQLAQELCTAFSSCEDGGSNSIINKNIMQEFTAGQTALGSSQCEGVASATSNIAKLIQAILVDLLAYHAKVSEDEVHCHLAHVSASALVPHLRSNIDTESLADTIQSNIEVNMGKCQVVDVEAIYRSLNTYVTFMDIDCALLGSTVCDGTSMTPDSIGYENNADYTPNTNNGTLFKGAYIPTTDVSSAEALFSVVSGICQASSSDVAKNIYNNDTTAGLSVRDMSIQAKYLMADELLFHLYIYALQDDVDLTDGSFIFDNKPAADYANTITSDALDTSVSLGCKSAKVLNIWMWIIHKLNAVVDDCKSNIIAMNSGLIDEVAALWEGSELLAMAEVLGPKFSQGQDGGMTYLNRKIVDRLIKARDIISSNQNVCSYADVLKLRILVKETVSYMIAVLFQSLIDSMLATFDDSAKKTVELMAFATLPHVKSCGHHVMFDELKGYLVSAFDDDGDKIASTIQTLQSHYNCLGLSCSDVGRHVTNEGSSTVAPACSDVSMIAGYVPENITKTNMVAKLDLDVVAIHHLMDMGKLELAKKIYIEGYNYYDYDNAELYNFVSLYNLTQSHTIDYSDFAVYGLYSTYHGEDFSNTLITKIFDKSGPFENSTASQLSLAAHVAFTSIVSYMAALEALYSAASKCEFEQLSAMHAFDGAVALLIGSVEGQEAGGGEPDEGHAFYSIAKRNCNYFQNCINDDSIVNDKLYLVLNKGQKLIKEGQCDTAKDEVDKINSLLKVPLVQSLLYFSDPVIDIEDNYAGAYVAMQAVIPTLNGIDPVTAEDIKLAFDVEDPGFEIYDYDVRSDLRVLLTNPTSDIYCNLVSTGLCDADVGDFNATEVDDEIVTDIIQPPPNDVINASDPTPIPFVTSNYVGDRSAIALDVKQIQEAIAINDYVEALEIYRNGRNSKIYDANGIATGEFRSIAGLSKESGDIMKGDPTYNVFIYGLSGDDQEFMGRPTTEYADAVISNLLYYEAPEAEAAMVAITIWMQVAHSLHAAYDSCRSSISSEGRSGFNKRNLQQSIDYDDPSLFIDEAAAYWMGDHQDTGTSQGHLLYALTELIADKFEAPSESESTINMMIVDLLNKAKNHIAISRGCSTSENSHLKLKGIIDEIIPLMAVPLLRCLIHYLNENELIMVKVFATAVLPLFSACSSATYHELKTLLIDNVPFVSDSSVQISRKDVISQLRSMYNCIGLTCDIVGSMQKDDTEASSYSLSFSSSSSAPLDSACESNSLAGYKFTEEENDDVSQAALVDIDIRKIEIFLENGILFFADSRDAFSGGALELYKYGQQLSIDGENSLRSIARSTNRDTVPIFAAYRRYFDGDDYYADTMITAAFQKTGQFVMAGDDQRTRFISFALRYMIPFMAILEKIYLALESCSIEESRAGGAKDLDMAIAYYMGSLEGKEDGGSYDGTMLHMLANRMCVIFNTCSENNNAVVNQRLVSLVYTAQGELEVGACDMMKRTVREVENVLIVPLLQGILFSTKETDVYYKTMHLSEYEGPSGQEYIPEAYALAQSILPIIADVDQNAATIIKNVIVEKFPILSEQDSAALVSAIKGVLSKMEGVDCTLIGSIGGTGFCTNDDEGAYDAFSSASYGISFSFTGLMIITGIALVYM